MPKMEFDFFKVSTFMSAEVQRAYLIFNFYLSDRKVLNIFTEAKLFSLVCMCIQAHA